MRLELRNLHENLGITSIYVTHDQVEAMTLGDRLMILEDGHVQQIGSPLEVYERPATRFVAGFIGSPAMNFFDAQLSNDGSAVELAGSDTLPLSNAGLPDFGGQEVILGIRPEHFDLTAEGAGKMHTTVDHVETLGADTLVHGHIGGNGASLTIRLPDTHHFKKGTALPLAVPAEKLHLFDKDSGNRIEG
jgi:sn-glycerol 3-phosphate transport system ATP-binding protein